jgi:DNA-binding XRE family transcriptional regulator
VSLEGALGPEPDILFNAVLLASRGDTPYGCVKQKLGNRWLRTAGTCSNVRESIMIVNRIDLAIGAQIRRQRNTLRMSLFDLSTIIGVSEFEIAQFENGIKRVSAPVLFRLCKIFGVKAGYFFDAFDLDFQIQAGDESIG